MEPFVWNHILKRTLLQHGRLTSFSFRSVVLGLFLTSCGVCTSSISGH
jgi:hypothetical protein